MLVATVGSTGGATVAGSGGTPPPAVLALNSNASRSKAVVRSRAGSHGAGDQAGAAQTEQVANDQQAVGQRIGLAVAVDIERRPDVGEVVADLRGGGSRRTRSHRAIDQ